MINASTEPFAETATLAVKRYVEKNTQLRELTELQDVIMSCIPDSIINKIAEEVARLSPDGNTSTLNIDGFVDFRFHRVKNDIDNFISDIIRTCIARNTYLSLLDAMRDYVNETPDVVDELYITADAAEKEDAGAALDLSLEFLPRKIFIFLPKNFSNMRFVETLQYVFGNRVILRSLPN